MTATTRVTVPAMPWSQLLVAGFAVALVALALWDRRRRRRHWAAMVEQAREQGRRDAATGVWTLGIAVLLAFGAFAVAPSPAHASEPVGVTVDISPHPEPTTPASPGTGQALAQTGAPVSALLAVGGVVVVGGGATAWTISRRREARRASSPPTEPSS